MKDECNGNLMLEVVAIRSKLYSAKIEGQKPIKKAKGTKSVVVRKRIEFEDFLTCLFENKFISVQQYQIRSRLHVLHTIKQNKIAMNPQDDKRQLLPGTTDTWPWGYKGIEFVDSDELIVSAAVAKQDLATLDAFEQEIKASAAAFEKDLEAAALEQEVAAAAAALEDDLAFDPPCKTIRLCCV